MDVIGLKPGLVVGFPHSPPAIGGPGSFQSRLTQALEERGHKVIFPGAHAVPDIVVVVGGTSKLGWLRWCRSRGTKIVHRLDGLNWRHRRQPVSINHYLLSEARNRLMWFVRNHLAHHVVYQSRFIRSWWQDRFGPARCNDTIVYNGVDLSLFAPTRNGPSGKPDLLCVEGAVHADRVTVGVLSTLSTRLFESGVIGGTTVCGTVSPATRELLGRVAGLSLLGEVPRGRMHEIYARKAVYLSLEVIPPCPNSVVEALASGLPVIGFDTGSLRELVPSTAGKLAPYGADPWKLEEPDIRSLETAARQVVAKYEWYSDGARCVAERRFGLDHMVESYLTVFSSVMEGSRPGD